MKQQPLFGPATPGGFQYQPGFVSAAQSAALLDVIATLPLVEAQYRQFTAKRRVIHFGGRYDFSNNELLPADALPEALIPLRDRIGAAADVESHTLTHAMIAEYRPGTQLGWHRDIAQFELVAGASLGSSARMQFRPYPPAPSRRHYFNAILQPGSLYVLRGPVRWEWQHRVPPVSTLRYSITFRTLRTTV